MQIGPAYLPLALAMGATAFLLLVQMLIVDFAGIRARHVPGTPVPSDHNLFLFRATRAHANTNETIAVFILLAWFGLVSEARPSLLNVAAWVYVAGRAGHMSCYYLDWRAARSTSFAIGLIALWAMLVVDVLPWL
jgi:uncharacterized MAPEG superfamily protein